MLQSFLVGQPELDQKMDSPDLRQLKQRVGLRCNLQPLDLKAVEGYIHRRLELAGAEGRAKKIFSGEAVVEIYLVSKGIPRLVNTLCENSLMLGLGLQLEQITRAIVREVAADFRLNYSAPAPDTGESQHGPTAGLSFLHKSKTEEFGQTEQSQLSDFLPRMKSE